jgi:hypothetical protein
MTNEAVIAALQKYDKHLWGINASYKDAAKLIGLSKPDKIKMILFDKVDGAWEWNGNIQFFKCPDWEGGSRSPTKEKSIGRKDWDRLKQLFADKRELIESEGATMEFVIRLCRKNRLPANEHIVNELLTLKKMSLKGVV